MLKMVDGSGIIGVDMVCPLGVSTPQPPNYDRVELEGTGMLVLPNSLDAPLERLELGGKTEQVTTTGKNLANPSEFVIGTLAGDTGNIINLKQYITTGYIPVIPGKRYSTSCGNKFLAHTITAYDKEKTKINYLMNMSSEMPEGAAYIRLSYKKIDMANVTESDMEELKKVCMVNEGSKSISYEPYTGGKPSPSQEYQQEIKNSGKWNEEKQKYEVDVKITNAEQNWSKEQTLTLTSDRHITKWDRLIEQGGQIGWLYGTKKYTVTGNEVFESRDGYNIESYTNRYFILNDLLMENDALKPLAYMKCLRNVQYVYSANIFKEGFETNKNQFHIKLSNDRVGILASDDHAVRTDKFSGYMKKIHKNGNPIEILYATTDTVFVPLPQSEQNAIRALKTYYPTTVITVDGGELDPDIKVTYRKEI